MSFDRHIAVVRPIEVGRGDMNEPIVEDEVVVHLWAERKFGAGDERFDGDVSQRAAEQSLTFRTRYVTGVLPTDIVIDNGTRYDIVAIREIGRRAGLQIDARAVG